MSQQYPDQPDELQPETQQLPQAPVSPVQDGPGVPQYGNHPAPQQPSHEVPQQPNYQAQQQPNYPVPQQPNYPVPQQPAYPHPQQQMYPQQQPGYPQPGYQQPGYPQAYGAGYPQQQVAPKNPGLALVASFFIPGLGSLINGNAVLGIVIFAAYCIAWVLTMVLIGIILLPIIWIWGMIDAYQGAKRWNAKHGILS